MEEVTVFEEHPAEALVALGRLPEAARGEAIDGALWEWRETVIADADEMCAAILKRLESALAPTERQLIGLYMTLREQWLMLTHALTLPQGEDRDGVALEAQETVVLAGTLL